MSKNERVISDPEAAGWEFDSATGYWMWKGEEGTGGGLWTDNGGGSISYSGNVSVSDGNLSVTSSTDTAIINLNNSIGNYEIANNEFGSIAIKYNGDERFVLASNGNTYLYGQVNAPGATITGDLRAAKAGAGDRALAIGSSAGSTGQGAYTVAAGIYAGNSDQGENGVAIGRDAGRTTQGENGVAIGNNAGVTNQRDNGVAIGRNAGMTDQGYNSVAIGQSAGKEGQKNNSVAIGIDAGASNQGSSSIAIGFGAGQTDQSANGIIINSSGTAINQINAGHIHITSGSGKYLHYNGSNTWEFAGGPVNGLNGFRQNGAPVIDAKGLISTLSTLRKATMDETQDIRESLRDAIDELVEGFEQEIAAMPAPEPEASTMPAPEDS